MTNKLIKLITIPLFNDEGKLCVAEANASIPFSINRIFYIFDVDKGAVRGCHTHYKNVQVLFCIKGEVRMVLDNGQLREEAVLNKPNQGILLDKMVWHEMRDFSEDAVLLVLASDKYDPSDYIRDYDKYLTAVNGG